MLDITLFILPLIAALLGTPFAWKTLRAFYSIRPVELTQIADPIQRRALQGLHEIASWFVTWIAVTAILAIIVSFLGAWAVPILIGLAISLFFFKRPSPLFWLSWIVTGIASGGVLLVMLAAQNLPFSLSDYSVAAQLTDPYYLNPFFLIALASLTVISLVTSARQQLPTERHLLPPSLPDASTPQ